MTSPGDEKQSRTTMMRRRLAPSSATAIDFAPDGKTALEHKLELLETRFTMPLDFQQQQQQNPLNNTNNDSSPATLDPENSSPASFPSNSNQHSFGFDTPSLSSKDATTMKRVSASPEWQEIAVAHMAKVASLQENTMLTSHCRKQNTSSRGASTTSAVGGAAAQVHVQESPPFVSPKPPPSQQQQQQQPRPENKRKPIMPVKRTQPSVKENLDDRKRTKLQFDGSSSSIGGGGGGAKATKSPKRKVVKSPLASNSPRLTTSTKSAEQQNSRDAKAASSKTSKTANNNTKIHDFFTTKRSSAAVSASKKNTSIAAASTSAADLQPGGAKQDTQELVLLQQQYQELQRLCQDKDEQLKAVSNNRTILHSALQSALTKREQELKALEATSEERDAATQNAVEDLVRTQAEKEAKELRDTLAADGARLGRIVAVPAPTRVPFSMQRAVVESWEDGHASNQHALRRDQLRSKRGVMEARQKAALAAEERIQKQQLNKTPTNARKKASDDEAGNKDEPEEVPVVGGIEIRTPLDAREAVESARFHLSNIRRQEKELAIEEQTLNDEKGSHIRALKRVASEDASRFRSRPKLHDRYVLKSLLGRGGFSEVWRAFDLQQLCHVAVKIHQLDSRWPDAKKENYTKHVSREYEIHRNVRHPRIVSLFDVFEIDNNSFATVLECCPGTDLDTLLKTKRRLGERDARAILLQILSGMNYLSHPSEDGSRQGIIHYDLKPGNILFDDNGDAKITDFGLSKIVDSPDAAESMELTSQGAGTYWYLPPECFVMEESVRISNKVDVWSIGVIFYQMLFGKRPFGDGQSQDRILTDGTMLNAREVTFPDKPDISDECKEFIRACLTYDQSFRPSIAQVCGLKYVLSRDI